MSNDELRLAGGIVLCVILALLIAGAKDRVVIFEDFKDVYLTALGVALPPLGGVLTQTQLFDSDTYNLVFQTVFSPLVIGAGGLLIIRCYWVAGTCNRSVLLGAMVGTFKLVFALLVGLIVLRGLRRMASDEASMRDVVMSGLIVGACAALTRLMVNGERIAQRRSLSDEDGQAVDVYRESP